MSDDLWVNRERTIMVIRWTTSEGTEVMDVATRTEPGAIWGPPVRCEPDGRKS